MSTPGLSKLEADKPKEQEGPKQERKMSLDWNLRKGRKRSLTEPIREDTAMSRQASADKELEKEREAQVVSPSQEVKETSVIDRKFEDGHKTINNYAILFELGRGASGKVKLVLDVNTNQHYVSFLEVFLFWSSVF